MRIQDDIAVIAFVGGSAFAVASSHEFFYFFYFVLLL
jgi:hypothetical protein